MQNIIGNYLGIDPGRQGGIALLSHDGIVQAWEMPETEQDIHRLFRHRLKPAGVAFCLIERVHAWPGEGVHSVSVFMRHDGYLCGMLDAFEIRHEEINPEVWQKALGIPPRRKSSKKKEGPELFAQEPESKAEFKNRLLAMAKKMYPRMPINLSIADALLIAEVARRIARSGL
jgi:hypothetical protein